MADTKRGSGMNTRYFLAATLAATIASAAGAASPDDRPKTVAALLDCRTLTDDAVRLRCYDRAATGLAAARQSGELVTLDGRQVAAAKRQKFGLPAPRAVVVRNAQDQQLAELRQIDSTIVAVRPSSYGRYVLALANGGAWETAEPLSFPPVARSPIRIVRSGFGGFRATAGKGRSFLIKRVG